MECSCPRDALCDACVADSFAQLRGVAASRGTHWAERVWPRAHRAERSSPWPGTERARRMAVVRVADLTRDARLGELLADELAAWAAKRWESLRITSRQP